MRRCLESPTRELSESYCWATSVFGKADLVLEKRSAPPPLPTGLCSGRPTPYAYKHRCARKPWAISHFSFTSAQENSSDKTTLITYKSILLQEKKLTNDVYCRPH